MEERCLVCGRELEFIETTDMEVDGSTVYAYSLGECTECGCPHKWTDVFELTEIRNLQIDEDFDLAKEN